jgi:mannose-6-phosphate isomerase-like protein (cupin superfamily)
MNDRPAEASMDNAQSHDSSNVDELRGSEKKEAFHRSREAMVKPFEFRRPADIPPDVKAFVRLASSDNMHCHVQILNDGGDNGLHYHANMDSLFYILKGEITVYGPDDKTIGVFGPNQGCSMPAGARYWFEKSGNEEAWLLHVSALPKGRAMAKRILVQENVAEPLKTIHYDGDTHKIIPGLVQRAMD